MNPKTFHVVIRHPLGGCQGSSLGLYIHKESWLEALSWVESTFPGVDTRPNVLRRNAEPGNPPRIGNSDPVWIHDVDQYSTKVRKGGKFVSVKVPEGNHRLGVEQVKEGLLRALDFLRVNLISSRKSFNIQKHLYETGRANDWVYDRLLEMKQLVERAEIWEQNLKNQLKGMGPEKELGMPEKRKPRSPDVPE